MSRREKEKAKSLDALSRIAYSTTAPTPPRAPPPVPPRPAPKQAVPTRPSPQATPAPEPHRAKQLAERKAKLEEERALKARRAGELARGSNLQWRGMDSMGVPASIRRTGFDRDEATVAQKLHDVLGEAKLKEGREKARAKGKRQSGGR